MSLTSPERAMTALKQGCDGSLDIGVGMLPAGLPLVHSHAHLLPQNGWPILGQPLTQLRQPPHEADHCCTYCEGVHAEVYTAGLAAGVDCQTEVTLAAGCLENLHRKSYHGGKLSVSGLVVAALVVAALNTIFRV